MTQNSRRCGGRRKDGRPCQAWAVRGSDPARCPSHIGPELSEPEEDDLHESDHASDQAIEEATNRLCKNADNTLDGELQQMRLVVRQILEQLRHELDPEEYARLVGLVYKGAATIVDIMRAQQTLSGKARGELPPEIEAAIEKVKRTLRTEP